MVNWDDLRVFIALARGGRLAVAAQRTGLDPTTISRRIARLERALNTTLFEADAAGHVLTQPGRLLLPSAEQIENAALTGFRDVTGEKSRLAGVVKVSLSEGLATAIVARRLPEFHAAHPDIAVELAVSSGFLNPSKREADVAIMLARPGQGPVVTRRLVDYRLGLYASRTYLAERKAPDNAAALARHPLVGYIDEMIYAPQLRYLDEVSPGLVPTLRSSSITAQHRLLSAGGGIGVLPCFIGDADPGLRRLLPGTVSIKRSFWLVVHKDVRRLARVDAFLSWLDEVIAENRPAFSGEPPSPQAASSSSRA